mgnify:CR=1 FL=1|jgi:LmbE family N-acetylglucosaminyl deacetylase|tara:strand:+ start:1517 stop:2173 length:657 start_codon:yes stop_codon:yes gene_type:complete
MNIPKKILVLAAHPDDETLGCGATLARLSGEGHDIQLLTFTDGVGAREATDDNRNPSLEQVSKVLGINSYAYGDFPDNAMDSVPLLDLCKFIEQNVGSEPDIIFTHNSDDLNVDHQLVFQAALTAFRPQRGSTHQIYSFHVPSSTDYNPQSSFRGNFYFKLDSKYVHRKLEALKIYDEEMREFPHSRSYENVENLLKVWGSEVGYPYCEKFQLIRGVQ